MITVDNSIIYALSINRAFISNRIIVISRNNGIAYRRFVSCHYFSSGDIGACGGKSLVSNRYSSNS
mgnify:CR=1 FL=1